jgi:hypothetical protein
MKKFIVILLLIPAACKEAYDPPVVSTDHAYLVVEGFINSGPDSTVISLSHTYKLNDTSRATPEPGATVTVEGSDGSIYPLGEMGNGRYGADINTLSTANQYQLHIKTSVGKEYRSDFVPFKVSPPIDSINWKRTEFGVEVYANTHDPQNASVYYRWDYSETWEFHAIYFSGFKYLRDLDTIVSWQDSFYTCWKTDTANTIQVASSARLGQDVIYEAPVALIPTNSWHISVEYSILVKQYVLTQNAYNFWLNMQRNTEQIGSIFSPQPSELAGNIHAVSDTTEQVIGYISAGSLQKQRIFIDPVDIPNWTTENYPNSCFEINLIGSHDSLLFYLGNDPDLMPTQMYQGAPQPPIPPFRFNFSDKFCVDCTQVGTNIKPSFWP